MNITTYIRRFQSSVLKKKSYTILCTVKKFLITHGSMCNRKFI